MAERSGKMVEKMTREEAIQFLTMQRDRMDDAIAINEPIKVVLAILQETGETVGYTPAFRCLVMGLEPEESIRWGK